jgi:hypothetical protein
MKSLINIGYLAVISLIFLFSSCVKDEVNSISLSKQDLAMKLGQSDSLNLTVSFTGDINKQPVTFSVVDSKIASVALGVSQDETKTTSTSFTKNIVVKAVSTGSTTVTVQVGSNTTKITVAITQTSVTFNQISAINYGPIFYDMYDIDHNYYSVQLTSGTAAYSTIFKKYTGTGKILVMNVLVPLTYNNIAQGDYNAANTADKFTFFPGSTDGTYYYPAFIIDVVNGARTFQLVSDGKFSVAKNADGTFVIEGNLNSETDGIVHFLYNGNITPEDKQMKDQTPAFTSGSLYYYADLIYASGLSNSYELNLKSSADSLSLFINTPLTAKDSIPSGKYPIITLPLNSKSQLIPQTIIPGYVDDDGTYLYRRGSWYWGTSNLRLESGFADVSRIGSGYRISYEMYNHFGVKFSGVYSGALTYSNKTSSSSVKAANVKGLSKVRHIGQKTIVNKSIGRMERVWNK